MLVDKNPLVSVCVATYNSAQYICETLDSIYNQTYKKIELVISDDSSNDNTLEIVKEWLVGKETRFIDTQILSVDYNTGTSANMNRLLFAAKGTWIKGIAGDDILFPNAIEKYICYINDNSQVSWLFAKAVFYLNTFSEECIIQSKNRLFDRYSELNSMDASNQLKKNYLGNYYKCPTHFLKREKLLDIGGFDEEFGILEDYPMWLKLLCYGEKCYFMDEFVMGYRCSNTNVSLNNEVVVNFKLSKMMYEAKKKYIFGNCPKLVKIDAIWKLKINKIFSYSLLNRNSPVLRNIHKFLIYITLIPTVLYLKWNDSSR